MRMPAVARMRMVATAPAAAIIRIAQNVLMYFSGLYVWRWWWCFMVSSVV